MSRSEERAPETRSLDIEMASEPATSSLPDLPQLPGMEIREADDLVSQDRLQELRKKLARDARSRREAEATSATLRMG